MEMRFSHCLCQGAGVSMCRGRAICAEYWEQWHATASSDGVRVVTRKVLVFGMCVLFCLTHCFSFAGRSRVGNTVSRGKPLSGAKRETGPRFPFDRSGFRLIRFLIFCFTKIEIQEQVNYTVKLKSLDVRHPPRAPERGGATPRFRNPRFPNRRPCLICARRCVRPVRQID
jgi:hypothetical protein